MIRYPFVAFASVALALFCASAWADVGLQSGATNNLPALPANSYFSNYYIDVPSGAQQLKVSLNASGGDVDLFVRYGSPFPVQDLTVSYPTVSYDLLNRYGQYHSVSSTSNESVLILPSDKVPLQAGRWYIALINGGSSTANGTLTATVASAVPVGTIFLDFNSAYTDPSDKTNDCDITYWTDPTPATPIGNNSGTTLGQQRKNALAYAANELVTQLGIPVTIAVQACGAHLGGDDKSATLAHAGATSFFYDEPEYPSPALPKNYTWYPATAAVRLNGSSLCGFAGGPCTGSNNDEIAATFNMDIGTSGVLNGEKFYLGLDPNQKPVGDVDFISIAMHEMTHGLGFLGLVNTDPTQGPLGAKAGITIDTTNNTASIDYSNLTAGPFDDIYDDNVAIVANNTTYTPFTGYEVNSANDTARAAAMLSGGTVSTAGSYVAGLYGLQFCGTYSGACTGLRWSDATAANAAVNQNAGNPAPGNFPSLYAPCDKTKTTTCATQPGSTLSHTVQTGDMMNAYYSNTNLRSMGLAEPMLGPIGWSNAAAPMPMLGQPIPSAWYDRTHSGHGFDFQLAYHDPAGGDVYVLTFYTYSDNGVPEWYETYGHMVDGIFLPTLQDNGVTLYRVLYSSLALGQLNPQPDPDLAGSVVVDFNQAANSPACRNVDRSDTAAFLAVMYWTIGSESGTWCMEPLVGPESHATPDYNGLWFAPSDSGWGFELLDTIGSPAPNINILMYLPPAKGTDPTWALASGSLVNGSVTMTLQQISSGFCRSCTPPPNETTTNNGTITLKLNPFQAGLQPNGTATFNISYPGGGSFSRSNIPIEMFSVPTGQ